MCNLPEHLNLLQLVCSNENVTLDVVEYLLAEYDPDAAGREIDVKFRYDLCTFRYGPCVLSVSTSLLTVCVFLVPNDLTHLLINFPIPMPWRIFEMAQETHTQ